MNHKGSAATMEPLACVDMVKFLYNKCRAVLAHVITDDNSKMQANCRWNNEDKMKEFGD